MARKSSGWLELGLATGCVQDAHLAVILFGVRGNHSNGRKYWESLTMLWEGSEEFGGSANDDSKGDERT